MTEIRTLRILLALAMMVVAGAAVAAPAPTGSIGGPVKKNIAVTGKIIPRHH